MQIIHRVRTANEDGSQYDDGMFFMFKDDAVAATLTSEGHKDNWKQHSVVNVHERGEYNPDDIKRQVALAKLTDEEKVILGLV